MGILGPFEWGVIVFIFFLLFGAKRIPGLARGIAQGIREFRVTRLDDNDDKLTDRN